MTPSTHRLLAPALLGVALGLSATVAPGCSPAPACSSLTCAGCCDAVGACLAGTSAAACGSAGSTCVACDGDRACVAGFCAGGGGAGGGTGGGTGGGAGGGSTGGGGGGAPLDAGTLALPAPSQVVHVAADVEVNAAAVLGPGLVLAGSRSTTAGDTRDGLVVRTSTSDGGVDGTFVGGAQDDQLFAVAARANAYVAVGLTRSYRGSMTGDQAFVVRGSLTGNPTGLRHFLAADVALEPRALELQGTGWVLAGIAQGGAAAYAAVLSAAGQPTTAVSFVLGANATDYRVRRVLSLGRTALVVGEALVNNRAQGFLAALDAATLAPAWGLTVTGRGDVSLVDAALVGSEVVVVGLDGADGLVLELDAATGAVTRARSAAGAPLRSVLAGPEVLVAGERGGALVVARLEPTQLGGTTFPGLGRPSSFGRIPLLATDGGPLLVARAGAAIVELPLNGDLAGACNGSRFGTPAVVALADDGRVLTAAVVPTTQALAVTNASVALTQTPVGVSRDAGCTP